MIQRGPRFSFALKSRQPLGIARKQLWKNFDGDLALELGIPRSAHFIRKQSDGGFLYGARRSDHGLTTIEDGQRNSPGSPGNPAGPADNESR